MRSQYLSALAVLTWYLVLPTTAPQSGDANAAPSPTISIWNTYKTREACEQDRLLYVDDPVIGARMKVAQCVTAPPTGSAVAPPN
jgi:hypothetical protein